MLSSLAPLLLAFSALVLATNSGRAQPVRLLAAESNPTNELHTRDQGYAQLADGSYMQSGQISNTFRWQASGMLDRGSCASNGIQVSPRRGASLHISPDPR